MKTEHLDRLLQQSLSANAPQADGEPAQRREVSLADGDSGRFKDNGEGFRAGGYNTVEKEHSWRTDAHPMAELSQRLVQSVLDDGGTVETSGEYGAHGRELSTIKDKHGRDIAPELVRSGAALPTSDEESMQAHITGISRRALGYGGSSNEEYNEVGQKIRDARDDFKPWEGGEFQPKIRDRRGLFSRAFSRGSDETKASLGGALSYIGDVLGNEEWKKEGEQIAYVNGVDAAANKRKFESYDKVKGFGEALDFVVETLGETAPGLIVDAVATAGTVAVGAATGGAGAAAGIGLMGAMRATAGRALMKGAKAGLYAGPAVSGFAQSSGAMYNRLEGASSEERQEASTVSGLVGAAANTLPFVAVLGRSLKATGLSDAALKPVTEALSKPSTLNRLKDLGVTTGTGALAEGATELAQTVIDEIIATEVGGDKWSLETRDAVDAGVRAVLGGAAMGGMASATANSVGFMREYNEARKGVDSLGNKVDEDGWQQDETVEEEQTFGADGEQYTPTSFGDSLGKDIDRVARRTFSRKGGTRPTRADVSETMEVAGKGQFDALTASDVPNLPSARYKELKQILEPKGKIVSDKEVGTLLESGQITQAELSSYAADSHSGRDTPVSGGYDSDRGRDALIQVFEQVVDLSRDNKIRVTDAQRAKLAAAEEQGTDIAIRTALSDIDPELVNTVYRHANQFDGRSMFASYRDIKQNKNKVKERLKREASPVKEVAENEATAFVPEGDVPSPKRKPVDLPAIAEEGEAPKPDVEKVDEETATPEGEASKPKKYTVKLTMPEWLRERREPTSEELQEAKDMAENIKDRLRVQVKATIDKLDKRSQAAKDFFAINKAKTHGELRKVAKYYDYEPTGVLSVDKLFLFSEVERSANGRSKLVPDRSTGYVEKKEEPEKASISPTRIKKARPYTGARARRKAKQLRGLLRRANVTPSRLANFVISDDRSAGLLDSEADKAIAAAADKPADTGMVGHTLDNLQKDMDKAPATKKRSVLEGYAHRFGVDKSTSSDRLLTLTKAAILSGRKPQQQGYDASLLLSDGRVSVNGAKTVVDTKGTTVGELQSKFEEKKRAIREEQEAARQKEELNRTREANAGRGERAPKAKELDVEQKVKYIEKEMGTRDASDGQAGTIVRGLADYQAAKARKDLVDPSTLSAQHKKAIADKEEYRKQGKDGVVKAIEDLEEKIAAFELVQAYPKVVESVYRDAEASAIARERGYKDDLRAVEPMVDNETGKEGDMPDVHDTFDIAERSIAAEYTRRTARIENIYRAIKGIKSVDQKKLLELMSALVKPTKEEKDTGIPLVRGRSRTKPKERDFFEGRGLGLYDPTGSREGADGSRERTYIPENSTAKGREKLEAIRAQAKKRRAEIDAEILAEGNEAPPTIFTHGSMEKQPGTRHLSARVTKKIRALVEDGDLDAFVKYLSDIGVLADTDITGAIPKDPASELRKIVRTSNMYKYRAMDTGKRRRNQKGLVVRDNETGKRHEVDLDAVTRWALRDNDIDFDTIEDRDLFNKELGAAVLSGLSALQNAKMDDGVSPAFSFDINTVGDNVVAYRMSGDKRASVSMGDIRGSIYYMGKKKRTQHKNREKDADPKVTDVADGDVGHVYRDDVDLEAFKELTLAKVEEGELTEEQGDELISQAEHSIFSSDFESGGLDASGAINPNERAQGEFDNREPDFAFGSRDAQHKLIKKSEEKAEEDSKQTIKALEEDLEKLDEQIEELEARDPIKALGKESDEVREATQAVKQAKEAITQAMDEIGRDTKWSVGMTKQEAQRKLAKLHKNRTERKDSKKVTAEERDKMTPLNQREMVVDGYGERELHAIVENGGMVEYSAADLWRYRDRVDAAPNDLLTIVAREHSKREKMLFDDSPDLLAQLRSAEHNLKRAQEIEDARPKEGDITEKMKEDAKEIHFEKVEELKRKRERIEAMRKSLTKRKEGSDISKGRRVVLQRKLVKVFKRRRGAIKEPFYKMLEMTRTRLGRIHPEAATRSEEYTVKRRNDTEYFVSQITKHMGSVEGAQKGYDDSMRGIDSPERNKYEEFLSKLSRHVRKSDPNFKPVSAKAHVDLRAVEKDREGFLSILREEGVKKPEELLDSLLNSGGYPEFAIRPEMTNQPRGGRKELDKAYAKLKEGGFLDTDGPRHLIRLVNSAMNWAAWNATHGKVVDGKWDSSGEFKRMESEVHPTNRGTFAKLYKGTTGRLGIDMSPKLRAFNSAMLALQSATVLLFSGVASIPEVAAVYARMRGDANGMMGDMGAMLTSKGRREMVEFARDFDIITEDVLEHSLQEMYNMNDLTMGRTAQKIQSWVFQYNGQNFVTKMTRSLAAKAGERYIVRATEKGDTLQLAELGLTVDDVTSYNRTRDLNSKAGRKFRDAVHRFVNEAVTNPRSSQLPLIANDPRYLLVTSLKKFFYGFYDNVHKALAKDFKHKRANGGNPLAAIAITAAVALPLALMAEFIRETIRYPFGRPKWQGDRDIYDWGKSALMATGALGPLSMAESVYKGTSYGNHPVVSAIGPTAQLAVDIATLDMSPSRLVPAVNQLPWAAQPLNEGVKNLIK